MKNFLIDKKSCQCDYSTSDNPRARVSEKKIYRSGSKEAAEGVIEVVNSLKPGTVKYRKDVAHALACIAVKAKKNLPDDVEAALPPDHVIKRKDTIFKSITPNVGSGEHWARYLEILKEMGYDIPANTRVPWKAFAQLKEELRLASCEEAGRVPGSPPVDPNALSDSEDEDDQDTTKKPAAKRRKKRGGTKPGVEVLADPTAAAPAAAPAAAEAAAEAAAAAAARVPTVVDSNPGSPAATIPHQVPATWAMSAHFAQMQAGIERQAAELAQARAEQEAKEEESKQESTSWFWRWSS